MTGCAIMQRERKSTKHYSSGNISELSYQDPASNFQEASPITMGHLDLVVVSYYIAMQT